MKGEQLPPRTDPVWHQWARRYPIVEHMLKHNLPLTRDEWLKQNYLLDGVPDEIPAHVEEMMPPPFREKRWGADED